MKRVCKWWRINLSQTFLSRMVDIDTLRMLKQSEEFLEHALNMHVHKNTKVLVVRHIVARGKEFDIIARVIKQKHADVIQLTLKDCEVHLDLSANFHYYVHPECITPRMVVGLIFATRRLILENYTMQDALCYTLNRFNAEMPCHIAFEDRHTFLDDEPQIVLGRLEFDCTQPFEQHYHSFIMALDSNCPESSPGIRNEVILLYNSWSHCDADVRQWTSLRNVIKCLNEGVPVDDYEDPDVDISALRQLDPLTLNKLTVEALHRLYF